jgi:protein TonB
MKAIRNLAALLSLGALLPIVASATTVEQSYLESCRKDPGVPVPTWVVSPRVNQEYAGKTVEVEFTVDATGKPTQFSVLSAADGQLSDAVVDAVKQWQFSPAHRAGVPVAAKVILPVRVIDGSNS